MINVVILSGGYSAEREVSLFSTKEIIKNLNKDKYNAKIINIPKDRSNQWVLSLIESKPDIVLSGLHGGIGEDGSIQGLLECLNIPYVGSKVLSSSICMDKEMCKTIMKASHIPIVDGFLIEKNQYVKNFYNGASRLGYPLVVKPNKGGSSIGISIVKNHNELSEAVNLVKNYGDDILIEKYIIGNEVTCGILENENGLDVLTVLDIKTEDEFYDYKSKYFNNQSKIQYSTLPEFQKTMISEIAKKAFKALKCSGYGCIDLIIKEEQLYVLEMNTLPGLTPKSIIPNAALGQNISFATLLDSIICFEINKVFPKLD